MALKKYTKIIGWDALDAFYKRKINGIHLPIENFDRVFCRCGETHASEGGTVHKCPKCGNVDFLEYSTGYYYGTIEDHYTYKEDESLCPDTYTVKAVCLSGNVITNREGVEFEIEEYPFVIFNENEIKVKDIPSKGYYRRTCSVVDIPSELIEKWPHFNKYKNLLEEEGLPVGVNNLINICKKINKYGNCLNDKLYIQYPYLGKAILDKILKDKTFPENKTFGYYLKELDFDMSLLGVYDYHQKKNKDSYYRNVFSEIGPWRRTAPMYKKFQEYKKENSKGYKIIEKFVLNGMIDLQSAINIIPGLNDLINRNFTFGDCNWRYEFDRNRKEYEKALDGLDLKTLIEFYIKENITLKTPEKIVFEFIKDVKTLKDLKIKVCEENLKVKNMNYYLNKFRLAETYKLPDDKIECFIDWFEKNPLKAVQLIENRRKLTKKQLELFLNEITEE